MSLRYLIVLLFGSSTVLGQCLTTYDKLFPDPTENYTRSFGQTQAIYDDALVISAPGKDTLGLAAVGVVYLYKKSGGQWIKNGILMPSTISSNLGFGQFVKIFANYILVGTNALSGGVYVFRKPAAGWGSASETVRLFPAGATSFGREFDLSPDENTLVVNDMNDNSSQGAMYVFHKASGDEFSNITPFQKIVNPEPATPWFADSDVFIRDNQIACAKISLTGASNGKVYLFEDPSGNFNNFQFIARLDYPTNFLGGYGPTFQFTDEGIFSFIPGKIFFHQKPSSGPWVTANPTCEIVLPSLDGLSIDSFYVNYFAVNGRIYISAKMSDASGRIAILRKIGSDWCSGVTAEVIYREPAPQPGGNSLFVRTLSVYNDAEIVASWTLIPDNLDAVGVSTVSFDSGPGTWSKTQTIIRKNSETNRANFGTSLYQVGNFLFTSAYNERFNSSARTGSVYVHQKMGGSWNKVNKINIAPSSSNDSGFGSMLAGYGNYVVMSAINYTPARLEIYKGVNGDFSSPMHVQSLPIPSGLGIDQYGNIAMSADWIAVSVLTNLTTPLSKILLYKNIGADQWQYDREITIGSANVITKLAPAVDIESNTMVASDGNGNVQVLMFNAASQQWVVSATLTASDPDQDPFFIFSFDGSLYGASLKIEDDKIFVGAPGKNFGSTNDVGAIYVYTHAVNAAWTSKTETTKLLPVNKVVNTYFGSSIDVLKNTLISGAASQVVPGNAFVVQSKDYSWTNTVQLLQLTGDTFQLDYFGISVKLSEDDFFIGASNESDAANIATGTVYVTKSPPLIKLEPPVCDNASAFNLFGYPFSGTWSGPGVVNATAGTFDPHLVGGGTYELSYQTPNCAYTGKLQITVLPAPLPVISGKVSEILCDVGRTNAAIGVMPLSGATYQWYYKPTPSGQFSLTTTTTPTKAINSANTGVYELVVTAPSGGCMVSQDFTVTKESLNLQLNPVPDICVPQKTSISLQANVQGGSWQISGNAAPIDQATAMLNTTNLSDGTYSIGYTFTSAAQCVYTATGSFSVSRLEKVTVASQAGSLCENRLTLTATQIPSSAKDSYVWYYKTSENAATEQLNNTSKTQNATLSGYYWAGVTKGVCVKESEPTFFQIRKVNADSVFVPNVFTPNGDGFNELFRVSTQNDSPIFLKVINRYGQEVFSGDGSRGWDGGDASAGIYFWAISYQDCQNATQSKKGTVQIIR